MDTTAALISAASRGRGISSASSVWSAAIRLREPQAILFSLSLSSASPAHTVLFWWDPLTSVVSPRFFALWLFITPLPGLFFCTTTTCCRTRPAKKAVSAQLDNHWAIQVGITEAEWLGSHARRAEWQAPEQKDAVPGNLFSWVWMSPSSASSGVTVAVPPYEKSTLSPSSPGSQACLRLQWDVVVTVLHVVTRWSSWR